MMMMMMMIMMMLVLFSVCCAVMMMHRCFFQRPSSNVLPSISSPPSAEASPLSCHPRFAISTPILRLLIQLLQLAPTKLDGVTMTGMRPRSAINYPGLHVWRGVKEEAS